MRIRAIHLQPAAPQMVMDVLHAVSEQLQSVL